MKQASIIECLQLRHLLLGKRHLLQASKRAKIKSPSWPVSYVTGNCKLKLVLIGKPVKTRV